MVSQSVIGGSPRNNQRNSDINLSRINASGITGQNEKVIQASLTFILQTEREIAPWKMSTPLSTVDLSSYVAVKFVSRLYGVGNYNQLTSNRISAGIRNQVSIQNFVQVWVSTETNISKVKNLVEGGASSKQEVLLTEVEVAADFMDGYL